MHFEKGGWSSMIKKKNLTSTFLTYRNFPIVFLYLEYLLQVKYVPYDYKLEKAMENASIGDDISFSSHGVENLIHRNSHNFDD